MTGQRDPLDPLSQEEQDAVDRVDFARLADGRSSATYLRRLAWGAGLLGLVSMIVVAWEFFTGQMSSDDALTSLIQFGFFTLLTGATAYGAGANLDMSASRLEREVRKGRQ